MKKDLFVAGKFDDYDGKTSKIGELIFNSVDTGNMEYHNGGCFKDLEKNLENIEDYKLVYWFADVPNEKPKLVREVKNRNKSCTLVTSKRNIEGKYSFSDLIYHSLGLKSNLLLEFSKNLDRYQGRIMDPLGNVFLDYNDDFNLVGKVLGKRTKELLSYTRIPSKKIGEKLDVPEEKEFFEFVRKYGEIFHGLIHAHPDAANRFFGNASFRCERGFPSFKPDDVVFVSRRNVDKREINRDSFVGASGKNSVKYFGDNKPSVDTPIQIQLYDYYPNVRYMLHSHAYVEGAPFTNKLVPCGAVEEIDEIIKAFPERGNVNFSVNLRGHGSLVLVNDVKHLKEIPYKAREVPEIVPSYVD